MKARIPSEAQTMEMIPDELKSQNQTERGDLLVDLAIVFFVQTMCLLVLLVPGMFPSASSGYTCDLCVLSC